MITNNIVKIYNKDDFKTFIKKHGINNHMVISIIQSDMNEDIKKTIISFMKKKSVIYKNVYFIIYLFEKENLEYITKKFNISVDELPYIIYIYNVTEKLVDVTLANTIKPIKESFSVMEEYYNETNKIS